MIILYEKPDCYERILNKETIYVKEDEQDILQVCLYRIQMYINKHFTLKTEALEDILQNTIEYFLINKNAILYKNDLETNTENEIEDKLSCDITLETTGKAIPRDIFWTHINQNIRWAVSHGYTKYKKNSNALNESSEVSRKAKEVKQKIEDNNLSVSEIAQKTGHRKSTILNYLNLNAEIKCIDECENTIRCNHEKSESEDMEIVKAVLQEMDEKEVFIIKTYIQQKERKDFKKKTEELCKQRGISGLKVTKTIKKFTAKCHAMNKSNASE